MKEFWEKQKSLLAQAKRVFDAGMAGKKSGDCFREKSTYAGDVCLEEAVQTAEENLKLYDDAIRGLLVLKYPGEDDDDKGPVPEPTGEQLAAEFDRLEKVWRKYLELATESELHQFGNGTAAAGEALACHLMLVRSHMRELDGMYHTMLHK
jgi:hypothetical protein